MPEQSFFTKPRNLDLVELLARTSVEGLELVGVPYYSEDGKFVAAKYYHYMDCTLLVSNYPGSHPLHIAGRDSITIGRAAKGLSEYVELEPKK